VAAFNIRRDTMNIKWLKLSLNTAFEVSEDASGRWRISFIRLYQYPRGKASADAAKYNWAIKQWRQALSPP
jgi:hypothetical protein